MPHWRSRIEMLHLIVVPSRARDIKSDALAMSVGSCSHARGTVSVADRYEADEGWSQGDRFWWEALNVSQCFV